MAKNDFTDLKSFLDTAKKDKKTLDGVQRRVNKLVSGFQDLLTFIKDKSEDEPATDAKAKAPAKSKAKAKAKDGAEVTKRRGPGRPKNADKAKDVAETVDAELAS